MIWPFPTIDCQKKNVNATFFHLWLSLKQFGIFWEHRSEFAFSNNTPISAFSGSVVICLAKNEVHFTFWQANSCNCIWNWNDLFSKKRRRGKWHFESFWQGISLHRHRHYVQHRGGRRQSHQETHWWQKLWPWRHLCCYESEQWSIYVWHGNEGHEWQHETTWIKIRRFGLDPFARNSQELQFPC